MRTFNAILLIAAIAAVAYMLKDILFGIGFH